MIVATNQLHDGNHELYCDSCKNHIDQVNVWWSDGRNDDGLGYSEVHVECAACLNELFQKSAFGEVNNLEDAIGIITA